MTDYFKPVNSKPNDQEPKETVKEIRNLKRRLKKLEDKNSKIKSNLEEMSRVNKALPK